jgi:hypothetical protein
VGSRNIVLFLAALFLATPEPHEVHGGALLLVDDPTLLTQLENAGFSFAEIVGKSRLATIASTVEHDIAEFTRSSLGAPGTLALGELEPDTPGGAPKNGPRRPFRPRWLERGQFELIAVVNRLDRATFDPPESGLCGEVRLVYRLALAPPSRPVTRLPMTVNVRIPQPRPPHDTDCRHIAARWQSNPDVAAILHTLPAYTKIEINFQSIHTPATRKDMDDSAEYVLRAFRANRFSLAPDPLFNTPRTDLRDAERAELSRWIADNLAAIDRGAAVVPERFLATRAVSVSPRGLAHPENKPFSQLFPDPRASFGGLPLEKNLLATTPELLVRRLDEATCPGCHQSRAVAGFHLLGEERDASTFNALAVGHSAHLTSDLPWRARFLGAVLRGEDPPPRPFSGHPDERSDCGVSPGFASWRCAPGLACRDIHHADVGVCVPERRGSPGAPCEEATIRSASRPEGVFVTHTQADEECPDPKAAQRVGAFCAPNWLGFTGGMCSERCAVVGETNDGAMCAELPSAGYEGDCFTKREPVEPCLKRHTVVAKVGACSATQPCRDDYACTRVPRAPLDVGACVPPYFVFQVRVDGPLLDR